MSEHNYQNNAASEQGLHEQTLEKVDAAQAEETASEKGRARVGPAVLDVLHHSQQALTPQQVREKLPDFSEQQINAAIQNLYKKGEGKLERIKQGRAFAYSIKPEATGRKRKGRKAEPVEMAPVETTMAEATAAEGLPAMHQPQALEQNHAAPLQGQAKAQTQQPFNATISLDGSMVLSKGNHMIELTAAEREKLIGFLRGAAL